MTTKGHFFECPDCGKDIADDTEPHAVDCERIAPALAPYGIIDPDYARVFSMARCLAWSEGYALLFHGSFTRDLDLIAVPWTSAACEPDHLMRRVARASDLRCLDEEPGKKEHGRLAWTLVFKTFGDPRFIDFSVTPRAPALLPQQQNTTQEKT